MGVRMRKLLLSVVLSLMACLCAVPARAQTTMQVQAPAGWGGAAPNWTYTAPANAPWVNGSAAANVTTNIGGRPVTMPARMSMAANAGRYAAGLVRANPAYRLLPGVGAWLTAGALVWTGVEWLHGGTAASCTFPAVGSTPAATGPDCNAAASQRIGQDVAILGSGWTGSYSQPNPVSNPNGYRFTYNNAGTGQTLSYDQAGNIVEGGGGAPATQSDWDTLGDMNNQLFYDAINGLAQPMPVELPRINPDPVPWPQPVPVPVAQPFPVPGTSPQEYRQPVVQVTPSPTEDQPWRVEVSPPTLVPVPDANGVPNPTGQPLPAEQPSITCGLPDTPACKIDETGTQMPDTVNPQADVATAMDRARDIAEGNLGSIPTLPSINWTFSLPTSCSVIPTPAFAPFMESVDICQFQPVFHDLMGVVWVLGGLFGAISVFWRDQLAA